MDNEARPTKTWARSLALGAGLFLAYSANLSTYEVTDTEAATLVPVALLRGARPSLDRSERRARRPSGKLSPVALRRHGHILPYYPPGPSLVALPFTAP